MSPVQFELKHSMIFLTLIFSFAPSPGPFLFVVLSFILPITGAPSPPHPRLFLSKRFEL